MDIVINALIALVSGSVGGGFLAFLYNTHRTNREKKALVLVFAQEFMMLFARCAIYYEQLIKGDVSFSSLFEITDSASVNKLAEVTPDISVLKTIVRLKGDFFQVIRWVEKASKGDRNAQSIAIAFFMGSLQSADQSLDRMRYREKKEGIVEVLDYLEKLNSDFDLGNYLGRFSNIKQQKQAISKFTTESKQELDKLEKQLNELRLEEKRKLIAAGKNFAPA